MQGVPWTAEDFLGRGDRAGRIKQSTKAIAQKRKDDLDADFLNFKIDLIKKNRKGKDVPFWAMADWDGSIPEGIKQYGR